MFVTISELQPPRWPHEQSGRRWKRDVLEGRGRRWLGFAATVSDQSTQEHQRHRINPSGNAVAVIVHQYRASNRTAATLYSTDTLGIYSSEVKFSFELGAWF